MKKEDFTKLGVEDALAGKLADASAEELKGFIPKTRFDEVNTELKQSKDTLKERDNQLEELKKSTGDSEGLQKQITDLQAANKAKDEAHAAEIKKLQVDSAVEKALVGAKAKNTKAVKALLSEFLEKAELDGESIKGLDDEIKKLTEADDSKFLFDIETKQDNKAGFKGVKPGEKKDGTPGDNQPASLGDAIKAHLASET